MQDTKYSTEHIDHVPTHATPQSATYNDTAGSEGVSHSSEVDVEDALKHGKDPNLPSNHPINALGRWRKFGILMTLSWAGFLANYSAAMVNIAFFPMADYFGVTPGAIANTIGYNLLGIAIGPLFYNPLSKTIGRRPTYLLGSVLFIPTVIWMALSKTYISFAVARAFAGLTSSFSQTVPPSTVADIYRKEVRGDKMSVFGLFVIIAPAIAPFIGGFIITHHDWQTMFWVVLGFAVLQLILFILLVPETLWNEHEGDIPLKTVPSTMPQNVKPVAEHVELERGRLTKAQGGRVGAAWMPWQRPGEFGRIFLSPILMARFMAITVPSFYYGSLFAWSVGITVVLPQTFPKPPYDFSTIAVGCTFLAYGVGSVIGKPLGGIVGDKAVTWMQKRHGGHRQPEYRLWALLPVLPLMFVGLFLVGIAVTKVMHWIVPLIGGGLYFACLVCSTGILQTYVLETYITKSMDTQLNFIFWKSMWGFAIPFFVYEWGEKTSFTESYAVQGALAAGLGAIICLGLIYKGHALRSAQGMPTQELKPL